MCFVVLSILCFLLSKAGHLPLLLDVCLNMNFIIYSFYHTGYCAFRCLLQKFLLGTFLFVASGTFSNNAKLPGFSICNWSAEVHIRM